MNEKTDTGNDTIDTGIDTGDHILPPANAANSYRHPYHSPTRARDPLPDLDPISHRDAHGDGCLCWLRTEGAAMTFQQFLNSLPGNDVMAGTYFIRRELTEPVKVKVKYWMNEPGDWVWRTVSIKYLWPKCFQDVIGWQKPYWCIVEWKE